MAQSLLQAHEAFYSALHDILKDSNTQAMEDIWSRENDITNRGPFTQGQCGRDAVMSEFHREASCKLGGKVTITDLHVVETPVMGYTTHVECIQNLKLSLVLPLTLSLPEPERASVPLPLSAMYTTSSYLNEKDRESKDGGEQQQQQQHIGTGTAERTTTSFRLRVTNIYRKESNGWHIVHHHTDRVHNSGSPPPSPSPVAAAATDTASAIGVCNNSVQRERENENENSGVISSNRQW